MNNNFENSFVKIICLSFFCENTFHLLKFNEGMKLSCIWWKLFLRTYICKIIHAHSWIYSSLTIDQERDQKVSKNCLDAQSLLLHKMMIESFCNEPLKCKNSNFLWFVDIFSRILIVETKVWWGTFRCQKGL